MLSILCVTRGESYALPFLRDLDTLGLVLGAQVSLVRDSRIAKGILEDILTDAVATCTGTHVLRLDDDEAVTPALFEWLDSKQYLAADAWAFPTAACWGNPETFLMEPPLWPDPHVRLTLKPFASGPRRIHAGSAAPVVTPAPVLIAHHKFLVKSRAEREALAAHYDGYYPGHVNGDLQAFNLPEVAFAGRAVTHARLGAGRVDAPRFTWKACL